MSASACSDAVVEAALRLPAAFCADPDSLLLVEGVVQVSVCIGVGGGALKEGDVGDIALLTFVSSV